VRRPLCCVIGRMCARSERWVNLAAQRRPAPRRARRHFRGEL